MEALIGLIVAIIIWLIVAKSAEATGKASSKIRRSLREIPCPKCGGNGYIVTPPHPASGHMGHLSCLKCAGTGKIDPKYDS